MVYSELYAANGTTGATATIQSGVSIKKVIDKKISNTDGDLLFGTIVPDATEGTVLINPSTAQRSSSLFTVDQENGPAVFQVTAAPYKCHSITVQSESTVLRCGDNTMIVDNWKTNMIAGTTDENGNSNFTIGGTLHVKPYQAVSYTHLTLPTKRIV